MNLNPTSVEVSNLTISNTISANDRFIVIMNPESPSSRTMTVRANVVTSMVRPSFRMVSANSSVWEITVSNTGVLVVTAV